MAKAIRQLVVLISLCVAFSGALFATTPSITSLSPPSGAIGASVTITGANFGTTQGTSTVTFNGTAATTITSWGATSIVAAVPTGAAAGYVVVTVGGVVSNSVSFTVVTANFTLTGSLAVPRMFHTATLLDSGTVLVAGGVDGFAYDALSSAELYSPVAGTFTTTGSLNTARIFNTATLLSNGQVLIAGGSDSNWNQTGTAELYDPASGTFTFTGALNTARTSHTATFLTSGKVLIVGGWDSNGDQITGDAAGSELYGPTSGTFVSAGNLNTARDTHTATLLNNGKVLIVGGFDSNSNILSSTELYDPTAGIFNLTGSLNVGRAAHTATLLNNGLVLIAGGYDLNGNAVASAELYDAATGTFTVTGSMSIPRYDGAQGTLLSNGTVLIAGGQDNNGNSLASAELYDPAAGTFTTVAGNMNTTRQSLTTTLLNNGQVLVAAGMDFYSNVLNTAELYQPSSLTPAGLVSIVVSPSNPSVSVGATEPFAATGTFSDNSTQTLASATWASSNSTVATIANDASNHGHAIGLATGSSTVSACAGSVCGSTTMNVTATLASITLAPANPSLTIGSGHQITATGTFSDGSTLDVTTSATWSSSNNSVVLVGTTPGFQGFAMGAASGTATISATLGSTSANMSITVQNLVTPVVPSITSVSPTTGAAGTQVAVSGSGFGTTQGSGSVWLGSTYGVVVSWGDTQIVATVAAISTSGTAQVQQGGLLSNALPFNVNTATISNVSPASGVAGTHVTITGSGFGADQGTGQIWLGTANGVVQSWSDTQVVAVVATGATSGSAQILQGGVWSDSVPFAVNSLHVAAVTPTSGGPGTSVTITGTGFGSSQGSGSVWLGSTNGQVMSWSDTQVLAVVDVAALTGVVRIQQNGVWSNAETFTVPSSGANALTIVPNLLNMVLGETKTVQALNASSQPVTGLTWSSSNPTAVSLSTDDPPILTALAVGRATITAGTASADVTVFAGPLSVGTVIWSNPGNGSGVQSIVPAVPSSSGIADVFAFQSDGTVQAITSSGATAWTANLNGANYWETVPDFQGGLVVAKRTAPQSIVKLDGITGQAYPSYTPATQNDNLSTPAVHTDGTIFTVDTNEHYDYGTGAYVGTISIIGINPTTGAQEFSVPLDQSTISKTSSRTANAYGFNCDGGFPGYDSSTSTSVTAIAPTVLGNPIIAGDGYLYIPYQYKDATSITQSTLVCSVTGPSQSTTVTADTAVHLTLMRVGTDGSSSKIDVKDWESRNLRMNSGGQAFPHISSSVTSGAIPSLPWGQLLTNADQGTVLSWEADMPAYCASGTYNLNPCNTQVSAATIFGFASTVDTALAFSASVSSGIIPALQAQDGTLYGNDSYYTKMIHFDLYGNTIWSVPNDYPQIATADGGVIGYSGVTYDNQGRATTRLSNLPTYSWPLNAYKGTQLEQIQASPIGIATSFSPFAGMNASFTATAVQQPWYYPLQSCTGAQTPCAQEATTSAINALTALLNPQQPCNLCSIYVFNKLQSTNPGINQSKFFDYMSQKPRLWDGTRSYAPANVAFCATGILNQLFCSFGSQTVHDYMKSSGDAIDSQTPSDKGKGMQVFFDPAQAPCNVLTSSSPRVGDQGVLNQADLFHEALHGYTGDADITLETAFGVDPPSVNISYYVESKVIPGGAQGAAKCGN